MNIQTMNFAEQVLNEEKDFIVPIKKIWLKLSLLGKAEKLSFEEFSFMLHQDERFEVIDNSETDTEELLGNNKDDLEELGYYFGPRVMLKSRRPSRHEIGQILIKKTEQIFDNLKKAWELRPENEEEEDQLLNALASTQKLLRTLGREFSDLNPDNGIKEKNSHKDTKKHKE